MPEWAWAVAALAFLVLQVLATRSGYRLGVHDGWRAAKYPNDSLWNKQREMLRKYGEEVRDADTPKR